MEEKRQKTNGHFLKDTRCRRLGGFIRVVVLVVWDGLLLYMIVRQLIAPVYGAAFVAAVSVYMGYQL